MAVIVHRILEQNDSVAPVLVEHDGRKFCALVSCDLDRLRTLLGTSLSAEIEFDEVISARVLAQDIAEDHGLYPLSEGQARIVGAVCTVVPAPDGPSWVDVYLQSGPEFVAVRSDALDFAPVCGNGIELVVSGLCFYPRLG